MSPSPEYTETKLLTEEEKQRLKLAELKAVLARFFSSLISREAAKKGMGEDRVFIRAFVFDEKSARLEQCIAVVLSDGNSLWAVGGNGFEGSYDVTREDNTLTVDWGGKGGKMAYPQCLGCFPVLVPYGFRKVKLALSTETGGTTQGAIFGGVDSIVQSRFSELDQWGIMQLLVDGLERTGNMKL